MTMARSDRAGGFVLHGIDPIAELNLTAWDGSSSTAAVTVRAADAEHRPIALTLDRQNTVPIGGRVVDPDGRPIAGASVRLWRLVRGRDGRIELQDRVAGGDGSFTLHTGADGRYRTSGRFPAHAGYQAEATAPGRVAARSPAVAAARDGDRPTVLVLRRLLAIEGRVVDRRGQPVAGATRAAVGRRADADRDDHRGRRPVPPARRHRGVGDRRRGEGRLPDRGAAGRRRAEAGRGRAGAHRRAARPGVSHDPVDFTRRGGEGPGPGIDRAARREGPGAPR